MCNTAVLGEAHGGHIAGKTIYSDLDVPLLDSIPKEAPHREVDLAVLDADAQGFVRAWIVIPSTIWGRATGTLVDEGIMNPRSQQIPNLINFGLQRGQVGVIGEGKNFWPNVHIAERWFSPLSRNPTWKVNITRTQWPICTSSSSTKFVPIQTSPMVARASTSVPTGSILCTTSRRQVLQRAP
jgi:hypothetical protein